jgi:hypothetical protein
MMGVEEGREELVEDEEDGDEERGSPEPGEIDEDGERMPSSPPSFRTWRRYYYQGHRPGKGSSAEEGGRTRGEGGGAADGG